MALRDVVSYLISADDKTGAATASAKKNLTELRTAYVGVQRTISSIRTAGVGFISVQGLKAGTTAIIEARVELERMRNTLGQGVGAANVGNEVEFLRRAADQFGQSFVDMAGSYSRFAAATRGTAIEGQKTRDVFLALSKASSVLGLSADQSTGALNAIQQMISKGTVSAEELRGQLGERLPGAFQIAARSMGITTEELGKMLEQGQLLSEDFLPRFARQLETEFAAGFEASSRSASASINRLQTAYDGLKQSFAEGPIGDAVFSGIDSLTGYLKGLQAELDQTKRAQLGLVDSLELSINKYAQFMALPYLTDLFGGGAKQKIEASNRAGFRQQENVDAQAIQAADPVRDALREQNAADRSAESRQVRLAATEWGKLIEKYRSAGEKQSDVERAIRASGVTAGKTEQEIAKLIEASRAAGDRKVSAVAKGIDTAKLRADIDQIRNEMERMTGIYGNAQQQLEALRTANQLSDQEYFEAKRAFIRLGADAEADALQKENAVLAARKASAKERIDLDKQIADNQIQIDRIRAQAASGEAVLDIQQDSLAKKLVRDWEEARASAQSYLDTAARGYQRDLASIGLGQSERDRQSGSAQIEDRYSQQRQQLESERRTGAFDQRPEEYEKQLALIREFQRTALDSWSAYYDELKAKEQDGSLGFSSAMADYVDQARNSFQQVAGVTTSALGGLEEAFAQFATTGKLSFRGLVDSVIADMARLMVRRGILSLLGAFAGNTGFGTGSSFGNQDYGAFLATGTNYVPHDNFRAVLHKGEAVIPAKFNPAAGGTAAGGGVQVVLHQTFNMPQGGGGQADPGQLARMVREASTAGVADAIQRNRRGLQLV